VSNWLAVATVTATLRQLVQPAAQQAVPGAQVRTLRPDLMFADRATSGVNLFLYRVQPNATFRNADLATRRSDGTPITRPQAALELSYLVSFFGSDETLEPQRLLGATVATLHAWPVLSADMIAAAIAAEPTYLSGSDLAQQVARVHLGLSALANDELARLWTAFPSVPLHLSVAYQAAAVLVEEPLVPTMPLPVQQVHPTVVATDDPAGYVATQWPVATP